MKNIFVKPNYIVLGIAVVAAIARWSPMDYFVEAGAPAYYQARVAYLRGDERQRRHIAEAFKGQWISMHGYSESVFPAFLKVAQDHEDLLPAVERTKTLDELRRNLAMEISRTRN